MDIKDQVAYALERASIRSVPHTLCDTFDGCPSDPDSGKSIGCIGCVGDVKIETLNKFNPEWKDNLLTTVIRVKLLGDM